MQNNREKAIELSPERTQIKWEYSEVPASQLILLPQVRGMKNAVQIDLNESMDSLGMLAPIIIERMSTERLQEQLWCANSIWHTNATLDDYPEPPVGDEYSVVIAGHSRAIGHIELAKARNIDLAAPACVWRDLTPEQFISIQIDENIHSTVAPERSAIAIVNAYYTGLANKKWTSPSEFQKLYEKKISRGVLNDAMDFANLSEKVRNFVFARHIPYAAGLCLGRNAATLHDYCLDRYGETDLDKSITQQQYMLISDVYANHNSPKKSVQFLESQFRRLRHELGLQDDKDRNEDYKEDVANIAKDQTDGQITLFEVKEEDVQLVRRMKLLRRYQDSINDLKRHPARAAIQSLDLASALTGIDHSDDVRQIEHAYNQNIGHAVIKQFLEVKYSGD